MHNLIFIVITLATNLVLGSDVIQLDNDNFESKTREHKLTLVKFYTTWCGYCI